MLLFLTFFFVTSNLNVSAFSVYTKDDASLPLTKKPLIDLSEPEYFVRNRRYIGLSKRYKLNKRYQECVAPGEVQGHCKHGVYCPMDIVSSGKSAVDNLCIIEKIHVGVCCPDDILLRSLTGAQLIMDLPAGGEEYDVNDQHSGCGLTSLARPANNQATTPAKRWPWLVAVFKPKDQIQKQQFCAGALITDRHVLTAAHCFNGVKSEDAKVRLGEYDFQKRDETKSKDLGISQIAIHEEFNQGTYENDIAIITLDRTYEKETVTVAGWGQKYYAGPTSNVLLEVSFPVWEKEKCIESFAQRITDRNLCAAGIEGGKDSCLGDSGGPLVYQLENARWVAIGIVSWGIGCGNKGQPGIYTKVEKYIPWIISRTIVK